MNQKILLDIKKFRCPPVFFTNRSLVTDFEEVIKNLPKNSTILIREYDLDKKLRQDFAQKIVDLVRGKFYLKRLKILVGKDFALAKKVKANGVHFSDFDKLPLQFLKKKSFAKNFVFSAACHDFKSVVRFSKLKTDLVFISPIFSTASHPNTKKIGLRNLMKFFLQIRSRKCVLSETKLFVLGGISSKNIRVLAKLPICGFGAINIFN